MQILSLLCKVRETKEENLGLFCHKFDYVCK